MATGETKDARYKAALRRFSEAEGDHDLASTAIFNWARVVRQEGDLVEARRLALRGTQAHPASPGGIQCANLVAEIEGRSSSVTAEHIWSRPWPVIQVRYRNVTNVWFRLVAWNWDEFLERSHHRPEALDQKERAAVFAKPPAYEWAHALPATADYRIKTVELSAPADLKPGFYFLLASHKPDFTERDNQLSIADIWVSDLTLVLRQEPGNIEGFVLEGESGEPVPSAKVDAWHLDRQGNRVPVPPVQTDTNGFFRLSGDSQRSFLIKASARGQSVASRQYNPGWSPDKGKPFERTMFFTDRAIYRPGQIVHYKGICLRVDQSKDDYETLDGRDLTVVFSDPNGKEIARQQHRCTAYGSFSGSFTAPIDRLMGHMQIQVAGGPSGQVWVSVEEYKRPKFQVTLDAPRTAAKLNETVRLTGHAMAYTGAAVDAATVTYRVVREVRMPWWWSWYGRRSSGWQHSPAQEIAHGTLTTGTDGSFNIEFAAKPDPGVPEQDDPCFVFSVHVNVTDSAGETRSDSRAIRVGYRALEARVSADAWQTEDQPVELSVRTTTLDDEPQTAEGILRVHALKAPVKVHRPSLFTPADEDAALGGLDTSQWPLGDVVFEKGFTTDGEGKASASVRLPVGVYRVTLDTQDRFGKKVTGKMPLQVVSERASRFSAALPNYLAAPLWEMEPGEEFRALWGTGYESGRAFVEIEHKGRTIQSYWTKRGNTQARITQRVTEAMRGGLNLRVMFVRENRYYFESRRIDVPWSNKELTVKWEHFTSKLEPGQKETWTAVVRAPEKKGNEQGSAQGVVAEMVAALYDRSLDQFASFDWPSGFGVFRHEDRYVGKLFGNAAIDLRSFHRDWHVPGQVVDIRYRAFPPELLSNWHFNTRFMARTAAAARGLPIAVGARPDQGGALAMEAVASPAMALGTVEAPASLGGAVAKGAALLDAESDTAAQEPAPKPASALDRVTSRRSLNETAFFFPHLVSDTNGQVRITFTMPEALTEWRFLGFAHDRELRAGLLSDKAVTAKDLMVQPNPPRFLREGDVIEFTVKVSNQSDRRQQGRVRLTFADAWTGKPVDAALENSEPDKPFDLPAKESRSVAWRLRVPDGLAALSYKAVAATDTLSDGEEALLPVLARRILVTESLPLPVRGPATRKFEFQKLAASAQSATLRHQSLTVQMVSNPAWYAVMGLPYLMEFPYECSEQTFNRFYANALARFLARSDPRIRRVFDLWKNTPALESPLEKNREIKSVALEESPWLRQAQNETQARRNLGVLFDENRLDSELARALDSLSQTQLPDGAWPWFPGGRGNDYITLYICAGFGRLRQLGVDVSVEPALRAIPRLDEWLAGVHERIVRDKTVDENHLTPTIALYLYGRGFFLKDRPIETAQQPAIEFFLAQVKKHWLELNQRQSQGHLALALHRFGDSTTAQAIVRSLKERSVTDDELGRFWRDTELSWWWYRAPIETQALMIEAFTEIANDTAAVDECKVWLLKQKQTQDWKTTKATADAIYALLLRGRDLLASDRLVEVSVGNLNLTPPAAQPRHPAPPGSSAVEPGTGFYERRLAGSEVKPEMGQITVRKTDAGIAWGSVHWQYFEDQAKVTGYQGTPLKLKKALFTKANTSSGPVLSPVVGTVGVGDELVVRIQLVVDRDIEYVHLKDQRGSGVEPVNVRSGYRYQDGLAYYESTRDTASHFFIDYLPKGTYVFEYSTRVQHRGEYQTGIASIQCLYAPEFNSHSESFTLKVK